MIFQDPMSSLNPTMTVGDQIAETLQVHRGFTQSTGARARRRAARDRCDIPDAERARAAVSVRVLGRHAAARDDRDGDRLRARSS